MTAEVAVSLFPPLRDVLEKDAVMADEWEGSQPGWLRIDEDALDSDEDSGSPPLSTTSMDPNPLICNEEMQDSDPEASPPSIDLTHEEDEERPLVIVEEEVQAYHDGDGASAMERFISRVLHMEVTPHPPYSTYVVPPPAASRHGPPDEVTAPKDHCMILVGCFKLGGEDLIKGAPQLDTATTTSKKPMSHAFHFRAQGPFTEGDMMDFYHNTELIGQYLIRCGFPIINKSGSGSGTLVFRINDKQVVKVARYDKSVSPHKWRRHRQERNLDVLLSTRYPNCFAKTTYHWVTPQDTAYPVPRQEVYVQELLEPLIRLRTDVPGWHARFPNGKEIGEMLDKNRGIPFGQWGRTLDKRLVCYDYQ